MPAPRLSTNTLLSSHPPALRRLARWLGVRLAAGTKHDAVAFLVKAALIVEGDRPQPSRRKSRRP